jgi:putative transposase
MTQSPVALSELVEKGADTGLVRRPALMVLDVEALCGAGFGVKRADRSNNRNGYRNRLWQTRAGDVELRIPKRRQGSHFQS